VAGSADDPAAAFGPLGRGHPIAAELARLLAPVAADPLLRGDAAAAGAPVTITRHVAAEGQPDGGAGIVQLTWSAQWRDPAAGGRFRARSLIYDRRRTGGRAGIHDFPDDPLLPTAASPDGPLSGPDVEVLRYMAARRITFLCGADLVGKVKRARAVARSFARLRAVYAAARGVGFAVAEPIELDREGAVFYQRRLPGRPVRDLIEPANAAALLRRVGAVHAELHRLPVDDPQAVALPVRTRAHDVATVRGDSAWLRFAVPAEAGAVDEVERGLAAELEALDAAAPALCHGDAALDQVLLDGEDAFALVDFDDAAIGDAYADLGTMLTALPRDAPRLFRGPAGPTAAPVAAYLEGWIERSRGSLDAPRLRAHRLRAELAAAANRLHKGRLDADAAVAEIARLRDAVRER
jgi:aminoglycoside phosphotransferase (APT) family kinase protein